MDSFVNKIKFVWVAFLKQNQNNTVYIVSDFQHFLFPIEIYCRNIKWVLQQKVALEILYSVLCSEGHCKFEI
jgi:hypothetical protein